MMEENRYPLFFEKLFVNEGGFQNDPKDSGNYYQGKLYGTIYGVAAKYYIKEYLALKYLLDTNKPELAKQYAMNFYEKRGFWNPLYNKIIDSSLAFKLFDLGVNLGTETVIKLLQQCLNFHYDIILDDDGVFGNGTLFAVNEAHLTKPVRGSYKGIPGESLFYAVFVGWIEQYYRSRKTWREHGKGWMRRLKEIFNRTPNLFTPVKAEPKGTEIIKK
jgi:lysozyme family protein